jgi:hypothetical protein
MHQYNLHQGICVQGRAWFRPSVCSRGRCLFFSDLPPFPLNVSQMDAARPPSYAPPSTWYADVATPHWNGGDPAQTEATNPFYVRTPFPQNSGFYTYARAWRLLGSQGIHECNKYPRWDGFPVLEAIVAFCCVRSTLRAVSLGRSTCLV